MLLGPTAIEARGFDKWCLGKKGDDKIDIYPRWDVPVDLARREVETMVEAGVQIMTTLRERGFAATDHVLVTYGMSTSNPTKGRTTLTAPVAVEIKELIGTVEHANIVLIIRKELEPLRTSGLILPRNGSGLAMLYGALEYRPKLAN